MFADQKASTNSTRWESWDSLEIDLDLFKKIQPLRSHHITEHTATAEQTKWL